MGLMSKRKGQRTELEFAKLIGGKKTPLSGALGGENSGDVDGLDLKWECKARKDGFKQLYGWLENEKVNALALKANRKPWLVVMTLDTFMRERRRR